MSATEQQPQQQPQKRAHNAVAEENGEDGVATKKAQKVDNGDVCFCVLYLYI